MIFPDTVLEWTRFIPLAWLIATLGTRYLDGIGFHYPSLEAFIAGIRPLTRTLEACVPGLSLFFSPESPLLTLTPALTCILTALAAFQ